MTTKKVEFDVPTMHCGSCALSIGMMLDNTEGVVSNKVRYATKNAVVEYDTSATSPQKIAAAIEQVGYKAKAKSVSK